MKKISTVTTKKVEKNASQKLTIGLDLGDRFSWYCVLDEAGEVVLEQKVATTAFTVRRERRWTTAGGSATSHAPGLTGGRGFGQNPLHPWRKVRKGLSLHCRSGRTKTAQQIG